MDNAAAAELNRLMTDQEYNDKHKAECSGCLFCNVQGPVERDPLDDVSDEWAEDFYRKRGWI